METNKLCFQGGDVLVRLSPNSRGTLLLHKDVLESSSEFFKAQMKPYWSTGRLVTQADGSQLRIWDLGLVLSTEDFT